MTRNLLRSASFFCLACLSGILIQMANGADLTRSLPPSPLPGITYDIPFFPGAAYNPAVPTPDSILGFELGSKAATPAEIEAVLTALAQDNPRVKLVRYATSHEGRDLNFLIITSEAHLARIDELKADYALLGDPRTLKRKDGEKLTDTLPALAWMAYSIHGDELSGADAALGVAYHLAAGTGEDVQDLLENLVVIIDPLMNPDGRARCLAMVAQNRTSQPSIDDQSLLHTDLWPGGRSNHYFFDLNRDWLWASQPESRGRIQAIAEWHPHYFMEGHEMYPQDTFLFTPARAPVNPNFPEHTNRWAVQFADDHAAAFDALGWRYYTGEWMENWYPGYSSSWVPLRGAIGNLYEQASIVTDAVQRPEGTLETYRESVHKQLVSTMANLDTMARNREAILSDFLAEKRECVSADAPHADRTYALPPSPNRTRWNRFIDLMQIQGLELYEAQKAFKGSGVDRLGLAVSDHEFPAGTLLIPGRQPEARLLSSLMDFDTHMTTEFLTDERRELLRFNHSLLYEITGWSATMLYDLECVTLSGEVLKPARAQLVDLTAATTTPKELEHMETPVGFIIDGADDASVIAAGRLMERDVRVRVADKDLVFDGVPHARGSVLITRKDNLAFEGDLDAVVAEVTDEVGIAAQCVHSGLGAGDLPDLGGEHFVLLRTPRIAVIGQAPFSPYSYGTCWYTIDHILGLRASYLDARRLDWTDLRRYNVIVIPSGPADALKDRMDDLRAWTEAGGTLIAIDRSTAAIAREEGGIGSIRMLPDILAKPEPYLQAIIREWEGSTTVVDPDSVWSHTAPTGDRTPKIPWQGAGLYEGEKPDEDELKRRDEWRQIFMPKGAIVAGRIDDRSWLTAGCNDYLPLIYRGKNVLMVPPSADAPVRVGTFHPAPPEPEVENDEDADEDDGKDAKPAPGWTVAPPGYELRVRMSGLLWPEAAERIANSACVARDDVGEGQVILFATDPLFRASTPGTERLFINAVVCGPGMGADQPIELR